MARAGAAFLLKSVLKSVLKSALKSVLRSLRPSLPDRVLPTRHLSPALFALFALLALFVLPTAMNASPDPAAAPPSPTALHQAVRAGDLPAVKRLLAESPGTALREARDPDGRTPLLLATELNRVEAARALIEAGADVNAKDAKQDTPYLLAGAAGRLEVLEMTLAHGADLGSTNRYGGTALIPAAERGHVEVVRRLIEAGVHVDHVNRLGWTALLEAILLSEGGPRHQQIVGLLIDAGADVNLPDSEGVSPLQHAQRRGQAATAALLRARGAR
jgi:ankyrin repeat protein